MRVSRFYQTGQALPLGLAFIMFTALMGIVLFNTGQLSSEKSRAANAADAAIYSGLIWQSRALNFQAYTNRAMVANQVTIGQVVSITSWSTYGKIAAVNIDNTIGWFPPAKPFTEAFEQITTAISEVVEAVAEAAIPVLNMVNSTLAEAQRAVYMGTFAITPEIVKKVAETNDSRYHVESTYAIAGLTRNALHWKDFTKRYTDDDDEIMRKKDVIDKSLDKFTRGRDWQLGMGSGWFYLTPIHKFKLIKEGETRLIRKETQSDDDGSFSNSSESKWEWKGKDTLSFHIKRRKWSGGWKHKEIPIGWGGAYVPDDYECDDQDQGDDSGFGSFFNSCSQWAKNNRSAESLVNNNINFFSGEDSNVKINAEYNGLQAYYDLRDLSAANKDPRLVLRTEVNVNAGSIRTSSNIEGLGSREKAASDLRNGIGKGMFRADDALADGSLASVSSGEVYYKRPGRETVSVYRQKYSYSSPPGRESKTNQENYTEYANLFNPYWEVRLIDTPKTEKMAAWLLREPGFASAAPSAVPNGIDRYVEQQQTDITQLETTRNELQSQLSNLSDAEQLALVQQELSAVESQLQMMQTQLNNSATNALPFSSSTIQTASNIASSLGDVNSNKATLNALAQNMQGAMLENFQEQITDRLESVMKDALKNMLSRAASGGYGEYAQQASEYYDKAQDLYDYAQDLQGQAEAKINQLQDSLNEIQAEYEAVSEQVAQQFEPIAEAMREELSLEIKPLQDQINSLTQDLSSDKLTQQVKDQIQANIDDLQQQIADREAEVNQEVRNQLDALTEQATQSVSLELEAAKQDLANLNNIELSNPQANLPVETIKNEVVNLATGNP